MVKVNVSNFWFSGLQAELQAAYTEGECVKKKLKLQEAEMTAQRTKHSERDDELGIKYSEFTFSSDLKRFCLIDSFLQTNWK